MWTEVFSAATVPPEPTGFEIVSVVVQAFTVVVAIGAAVVALVISGRDRAALLAIARRDRAHDRLRIELEYAVRLSANRNMGGSSDSAESKRLGAEALALAGVVGERWVPRQYERSMDYNTPDEAAAMLDDSEDVTPRWVKDKIESGLAVQRIVSELYRES